MDSELLLIAVTTINGYVFAKYRYCLLVYENPFLEIHPFTGGEQPIPAGLSYPPPMIGEGQPIPASLSWPPPRFLSSEWLWVLLITFQLLINMFHKIQILPAGIQKTIS